MNKAGFRRIMIDISEQTAERLETLQQTIIESNTGEEAIDAGQVPNFTAINLLNIAIDIGVDELQHGRYDIVYDENKQYWKVVKDNRDY